MCRCDLGTDNTTIKELQVLCHSLSGHEIRNNCFIDGKNISNQKPGGVYYLSTGAKSIYSITTPFQISMKLCTCLADGYNNQCRLMMQTHKIFKPD